MQLTKTMDLPSPGSSASLRGKDQASSLIGSFVSYPFGLFIQQMPEELLIYAWLARGTQSPQVHDQMEREA